LIEADTVYFVGSGPGDPDLITLRAKALVESADVIVYSGSLLNPDILKYAKKNAELIDAALIDRERIYEILRDSTKQGKLAIRFHDGDPALFSTIREQIDKLERDHLHCKVVPGITALLAAASELNTELTLPGITQTIIITRAESRTPVPERERIAELGKHGATIAFYLSIHLIAEIVKELLSGEVYSIKTPAAVVFRATWKDQIILRGDLGNIVPLTRKAKITKTAILIIGDALAPRKYEFSKVYDPEFTHGFRKAST